MSRRITLSLALGSSLLITLALTGCSAGGLPGAASGGGATSAPSAAPAAGGGSGSSFTLPTSCLPAGQVQSILGEPAYGPSTNATSTYIVCDYLTASEDGPIIDIEPAKGVTTSNFDTVLKGGGASSDAKFTKTSGIGDAAAYFTAAGGYGIFVLAGKYTINIATLSASHAALAKLATTLLAG